MSRLPAHATESRSTAQRLFARIEPHLPPSVVRVIERRPHIGGRQLFAVMIPAGLLLGWLASYVVDPEIMRLGGKPYSEVAATGVRVQLAPRGPQYEGFPEDPAPHGYGKAPRPDYLNGGIAEAGDYADAEAKEGAAQAAPVVTDGQVLGAGVAPAQAKAAPIVQAVPQESAT
ncbi:MAG: hypothetical protein P0Y56_06595 [Candidatus Andeanibacterium colombiense]|uniref:Uncharacterized protein n=1 Tax=Candidatus Andeanibacterium colombiense TaxID=3121345 RepID=A0AAJ5XB16_9SPHN|nr:MAG: hypothetical protein P0Y56_06595 [Sphingomonadaceae bacterium]